MASRRAELRQQQSAAAARGRRTTRLVVVAVALLTLVLVGALAFAFLNAPQPSPEVPRADQVVPIGANADRSALVVTDAGAGKPVVTVHLDYQCPNCKVFEDGYGAMLAQEAAAGSWTLQHSTLTFLDQNLRNTASQRSALAAACAASTDHYAQYSAAIFAEQPAKEVPGAIAYSDELLRVTLPARVGFSPEQTTALQACYDGRATEDFVAGVEKAAYAGGVTGTPTVAVNGKVIDRSRARDASPAALKELILANA